MPQSPVTFAPLWTRLVPSTRLASPPQTRRSPKDLGCTCQGLHASSHPTPSFLHMRRHRLAEGGDSPHITRLVCGRTKTRLGSKCTATENVNQGQSRRARGCLAAISPASTECAKCPGSISAPAASGLGCGAQAGLRTREASRLHALRSVRTERQRCARSSQEARSLSIPAWWHQPVSQRNHTLALPGKQNADRMPDLRGSTSPGPDTEHPLGLLLTPCALVLGPQGPSMLARLKAAAEFEHEVPGASEPQRRHKVPAVGCRLGVWRPRPRLMAKLLGQVGQE